MNLDVTECMASLLMKGTEHHAGRTFVDCVQTILAGTRHPQGNRKHAAMNVVHVKCLDAAQPVCVSLLFLSANATNPTYVGI